jgi:hypothetical protein
VTSACTSGVSPCSAAAARFLGAARPERFCFCACLPRLIAGRSSGLQRDPLRSTRFFSDLPRGGLLELAACLQRSEFGFRRLASQFGRCACSWSWPSVLLPRAGCSSLSSTLHAARLSSIGRRRRAFWPIAMRAQAVSSTLTDLSGSWRAG